MKRVSISGYRKTIQAIWDWYDFQSQLSHAAKSEIRQQLSAGNAASNPIFFGMSWSEVEEFFQELDYLVMLDLLAATEAAVRVDYLARAYRDHKKHDAISKDFRRLYKKMGPAAGLEEDILGAWRSHLGQAKSAISQFKGALKLRHWLAHGRYWTPKLGRDYSPGDIYDLSDNLLQAINAS